MFSVPYFFFPVGVMQTTIFSIFLSFSSSRCFVLWFSVFSQFLPLHQFRTWNCIQSDSPWFSFISNCSLPAIYVWTWMKMMKFNIKEEEKEGVREWNQVQPTRLFVAKAALMIILIVSWDLYVKNLKIICNKRNNMKNTLNKKWRSNRFYSRKQTLYARDNQQFIHSFSFVSIVRRLL